MPKSVVEWEDVVDIPLLPSDNIVGQLGVTDMVFVPPTAPAHQKRRAAQAITCANLNEFHFTGPQYDPLDSSDSQAWVWLAHADRKVVGFTVIRPQNVRWGLTWAQYDAREEVPSLGQTARRWSVDLIWIFSERRRRGLARMLLAAAEREFDTKVSDFAWAYPLSPDGEALARFCAPHFLWLS